MEEFVHVTQVRNMFRRGVGGLEKNKKTVNQNRKPVI
jgi:hypothetical protein